jgi:hypothetical protein
LWLITVVQRHTEKWPFFHARQTLQAKGPLKKASSVNSSPIYTGVLELMLFIGLA